MHDQPTEVSYHKHAGVHHVPGHLSTISPVSTDRYPVTAEGRVIAVMLMISGAALFSTFTAFIATYFMQPAEQKDKVDALVQEVRALREELERHGISQPPR